MELAKTFEETYNSLESVSRNRRATMQSQLPLRRICMAEQSIPLTLSLPSDLRFMSVARAFVEAACHADWWSRTDTDAIVLSVHEAISNVIRHAHRNLPQAQLQIQCYSGPSAIEV